MCRGYKNLEQTFFVAIPQRQGPLLVASIFSFSCNAAYFLRLSECQVYWEIKIYWFHTDLRKF